MGLAIGIDLGTSNSVAALARGDRIELASDEHGSVIHPSVVSFPEQAGVLVGQAARIRRAEDPANTVFSAKRLIGQNMHNPTVQLALTSLPYRVEEGNNQQPIIIAGGRRRTVPEASAEVLVYLKRLAERQWSEPVDKAVITVPANFSDAQRRGTMEAGHLAGLEVLRLINEPTAAALAYGFAQRNDEQIVVFDFGGGTFDVSVLKIRGDVFEVLATDGDFFLGGDDIDRALAEFLAAEMNRSLNIDPRPFDEAMTRLMLAAEEIKKHLSSVDVAEGTIDGIVVPTQPVPVSLPFSLTRRQLDNLCIGYVDRTIEVCRNVIAAARLDKSDISAVLCVGGSTRIPLVRERIAEVFGREPSTHIDPDQVVARGAAIQAANLTGALGVAPPERAATTPVAPADAPRRPLLLDVTPATLSVATAGGYVERILEKNAPIPIERTKVFSTAHDNQTRVAIECCRGEASRYDKNEPLGRLTLEDLQPLPRGAAQIEVTFRVDTDGILHVRARDKRTGRDQHITLNVLGVSGSESA
jgi:molecular chaperone DnaK